MQQAANELEQRRAAGRVGRVGEPAARASRGAARSGRPTTTTTTTDDADAADAAGVTRVVVERAAFNVRDYLWTGTLGLFAFLGQTLVVFFVTLFLLASGNTFRRKMVKLAGPRLSQKKITVQALDEVSAQIQRYLLVQLATSVVVGVADRPRLLRARPRTTPRSGASSPASPTSSPTSAR